MLKEDGKALIYAVSKKDKYTWHWILKKITFNKFGVFGDTVGGHDRERFCNSEDIVQKMELSGLRVTKVIYFHSLFTLAFDENLPRVIGLAGKAYNIFIKRNKSRQVIDMPQEIGADDLNQPSGSMTVSLFYKSLATFLRVIFPLLVFVDKVNSSRGYSNGFYVQAEKSLVSGNPDKFSH